MWNILRSWSPPADWMVVRTIDLHSSGEPLRVIIDGLPDIPGSSILEKRRYFRDNFDFIRTALMWEPRGHADMYGAVITPPVTEDGDFGTFFLHNEGYSTMCGHAMIALVTLALDTGIIITGKEKKEILIDAPPGRITAGGVKQGGFTGRAWFKNVPSFVLCTDQHVEVPGIGGVQFDIAYGGAFYAFVQAENLDLKLDESEYSRLIDLGRRIKQAVMKSHPIVHPFEQDFSFLYGTIFIGPPHNPENHSRNVCIFADGEVDRSPTGSGVSARAALNHYKNELKTGQPITIESIIGTTMVVEISETTQFAQYQAVVPKVSGSASITGKHDFYISPNDPLKNGFFLR